MAVELVCRFPEATVATDPLSRVRSTLIASSLHAFRKRGLEARHAACLPAELRETVASVVPGVWIPIELALAHYQACDALALPEAEIRAIGADVGIQVNQSVLQTISKLATTVGATPWLALEKADRFAARMWQGGGLEVWRLGPKEARVVFKNHALMGVPYFRSALCSTMQSLVLPLARAAFSRVEAHRDPAAETRLRLSWV